MTAIKTALRKSEKTLITEIGQKSICYFFLYCGTLNCSSVTIRHTLSVNSFPTYFLFLPSFPFLPFPFHSFPFLFLLPPLFPFLLYFFLLNIYLLSKFHYLPWLSLNISLSTGKCFLFNLPTLFPEYWGWMPLPPHSMHLN